MHAHLSYLFENQIDFREEDGYLFDCEIYKRLYILRSSNLEKAGRTKIGRKFPKKIIFLKNTNKLIVILNFSGDTASSRDALKFLKRMTYIVINIHNFRPPGWLYSPVRMRNSSQKKSHKFRRLPFCSILYFNLIKFSENRDKEFQLGLMLFQTC